MKRIRYLAGDFPKSFVTIGEKINAPNRLDGFEVILLEEDGDSYKILKNAIASEGIDIQDRLERVLFDKGELNTANNLSLIVMGKKPFGYPQPASSYKYCENVYKKFCGLCGVHKGQIQPFRISKIPEWNKNFNWFSINWVYDVSFINKDIYTEYIMPYGIDFWPVFNHEDGSILEHVVQLKLPTLHHDLSEYFRDWPYEVCSDCGYRKAHPKYLDYFPIIDTDLPMALTQEFFGSGITAQQRVTIRRDVAELFVKLKLIKYDTYCLWPSRPSIGV